MLIVISFRDCACQFCSTHSLQGYILLWLQSISPLYQNLSKYQSYSYVFVSLYPKSVENCVANVWQYPNKKYKIPTLWCTIKGFLVCNLYRNRTPKHLFHSEIAKNATIRRKIAKMYWLFLVFSEMEFYFLVFFWFSCHSRGVKPVMALKRFCK